MRADIFSMGGRSGFAGRTVLSFLALLSLAAAAAESTAAQEQLERAQAEKKEKRKAQSLGELPALDIRVSSLQGLTPGETTREQLHEELGEPVDQKEEEEGSILVYQIGPFPRVEFFVREGITHSIAIHLAQPESVERVAEQLGLHDFSAVPVYTPEGELLGEVYPERGVVFRFAPDTTAALVSHLMLEPITAEPFVLRAKHQPTHYRRNLAGLNYALKQDPDHGEAHWLKARILQAAARNVEALSEAKQALRLSPAEPRFQLTYAVLLYAADRYDQAVGQTRKVLELEDVPPLVKARAECQLGDLLADGPERDYTAAIEHHQAAIELVGDLASSSDAVARRSAKRVLIDAHLALAVDVARGKWRRKEETVSAWLNNAQALITDAIDTGDGGASLKLQLLRKTLAAYTGLEGEMAADSVVEQALREGQELIDAGNDPLREKELQWQLVESLFDAIHIEQLRGDGQQVREYATRATRLLEEIGPQHRESARDKYLIGRLYFVLGSSYALDRDDHDQAVQWYEKAIPYLAPDVPATRTVDRALHGQRFVSMGVSYWQVDARNEAVRLSEKGLDLMQQAYTQGALEKNALAVPYSNLAAMYQAQGRNKEAQNYLAKVKEVEKSR